MYVCLFVRFLCKTQSLAQMAADPLLAIEIILPPFEPMMDCHTEILQTNKHTNNSLKSFLMFCYPVISISVRAFFCPFKPPRCDIDLLWGSGGVGLFITFTPLTKLTSFAPSRCQIIAPFWGAMFCIFLRCYI